VLTWGDAPTPVRATVVVLLAGVVPVLIAAALAIPALVSESADARPNAVALAGLPLAYVVVLPAFEVVPFLHRRRTVGAGLVRPKLRRNCDRG
jgi:hypothetical protein